MKSILLTTTAIVAFAGAAAADGHAGVSFSGSATLGYNTDDAGTGDNDGFYADAAIDVSMVAALDNGITATVTASLDDIVHEADVFDFDDLTLEIASENASLTFGGTDPSADKHWSGVDGDTVGDFRGQTEHFGTFEAIIRGEATMSGVTASVSYGIQGQDDTSPHFGALQVAAVAEVSGFTVIGAYEAKDDDYGLDSQMGVSVAGAVSGFDVKAAYSTTEDDNTSSLGLSVAYPVGAVTVGGYYSMNSSDDATKALDAYGLDVSYSDGPISISADYDMIQDASEGTWEVDANYDTGLGAVIHAGLNSAEAYYIAATYDLGGGASLLASYAVDDAGSSDEIGEDDLQEGMTVEVSFSF